MRKAKINRKTSETDVSVYLDLDGKGDYEINTVGGFFDHMLESLARHSSIDIRIKASGDNEHHIVEDVGITLGEAIRKTIGDKKGINRFGHSITPMDDVLMLVALDLGGRPFTSIDFRFRKKKIEDLSSEMIEHFLQSFATEARLNLHIKLLEGRNDHHRVEAMFKGLALALKMAVARDSKKGLPSTKGVL